MVTGRGERVVGYGDEIESVTTVVAELDERTLGVGFDDGADGSGGPAAGVGDELLPSVNY